MKLYTIGHSNHPAEKFYNLLAIPPVELLVDVRSTPYSRYNPHFNQNALQKGLPEHAIQYVYQGERLGGRPRDPSCYIHGSIPGRNAAYLTEVKYAEVMQRPWFISGIQTLLELASHQATVILCSEEDPNRCHRHHLIARYLMKEHPEWTILHIRGDGSILDARSLPPLDEPGIEQLTFQA